MGTSRPLFPQANPEGEGSLGDAGLCGRNPPIKKILLQPPLPGSPLSPTPSQALNAGLGDRRRQFPAGLSSLDAKLWF